ncbi:MAG: hypothetical protein JJT75_03285 [Opitutales bacterium]|nr:hypothetical protein [Opitutales bacterium]MCH8541500.1 hypothetical protein [Opitutales bacterium]
MHIFLLVAAFSLAACSPDDSVSEEIDEVVTEEAFSQEQDEESEAMNDSEKAEVATIDSEERDTSSDREIPDAEELSGEDMDVEERLAKMKELQRDAEFAEAWQMGRDFLHGKEDRPEFAEIEAMTGQLGIYRRQAPELRFALDQLNDPNPTVRSVASDQLLNGGETARILLRHVVRAEEAEMARQAAEILLRMRDEKASLSLMERIETEEDAALATSLGDILSRFVSHWESATFAEAGELFQRESRAVILPVAKAIMERLGEEPDAFSPDVVVPFIASYLQQIPQNYEEREILEKALAAALLTEQEGVVESFAEFRLLFLLVDDFVLGEDPQQGEYEVRGLGGQDPRIPGAEDRWRTSSGDMEVREAGLSHVGLESAGGSIGHDRPGGGYTGINRPLERALGEGSDEKVLWFASLHRVSGFTNANNRSHWNYDLGEGTVRWGIYEQQLHALGENLGEAEAGKDYLFVTKLEKNVDGFDDRYSVWVFAPNEWDENGLGSPSATGQKRFWANEEAIDRLRFDVQGDREHDEIGYVGAIRVAERLLDLGLNLRFED